MCRCNECLANAEGYAPSVSEAAAKEGSFSREKKKRKTKTLTLFAFGTLSCILVANTGISTLF